MHFNFDSLYSCSWFEGTSALINSRSISLLGWDAFWHKLKEVSLFLSEELNHCACRVVHSNKSICRKGRRPEWFSEVVKLWHPLYSLLCLLPLEDCYCVTVSAPRTLLLRYLDNVGPSSVLFSENTVGNIILYIFNTSRCVITQKSPCQELMLPCSYSKCYKDNCISPSKIIIVSILQAGTVWCSHGQREPC